MSHQSEAILENNLIKQLIDLGYESAKVIGGITLVSNIVNPAKFQERYLELD